MAITAFRDLLRWEQLNTLRKDTFKVLNLYSIHKMLHDLSVLTTEEIIDLFIEETKHFLSASQLGMSHNTLNEILVTLKAITDEIESRRKAGKIKFLS